MELILGSSSPRRKEIMQFFTYPFRAISPPYDESQVPFTGDPKAYVATLAREKGQSLKPQFPNDIIVSADTIVFVEGKVIGKPKNEEEMRSMLSTLAGKRHSVFTALHLISPTVTDSAIEETEVVCNRMTPEEIHCYMRGHSLYDKAGSYAIQRSGSLIVKEIHGCYYNVMGLPINALRKLLQRVGIDLWHYLQPF
ncbi:MAG TPA: Maf family nucleotide pyrophosphatase [Chlamydiales bacterium]|nr:Maf family nucleotide pyrophosphatase [Chlamydiales bacterium]